MVAITGQVPVAMIGRDAFQESDILGIKLFHNLYKHACSAAKIQISCLQVGLVKHTNFHTYLSMKFHSMYWSPNKQNTLKNPSELFLPIITPQTFAEIPPMAGFP